MTREPQYLTDARELGREAGRAAGSWAADGNTPDDHRRRVLGMLADGDPRAWDYLPAAPELSGQWADGLTPLSLAELVGYTDNGDDVGELCDAWEEGVLETFEDACVEALRAGLSD